MSFLLTLPCTALDTALIKQQRLVNQSPSLGISSHPCALTLSYKHSDMDSCRKDELEDPHSRLCKGCAYSSKAPWVLSVSVGLSAGAHPTA